jgi:hypothetical protein
MISILTRLGDRVRISSMKKHVSELPIETILRVAQQATRRAAADAVKAGRNVYGWEDGKLVKYGPNAQPLSQNICEEESLNVRAA